MVYQTQARRRKGNHGYIKFDNEMSLPNVINKNNYHNKELIDGVYILNLALVTKIKFDFPENFNYEKSKLEEVSAN